MIFIKIKRQLYIDSASAPPLPFHLKSSSGCADGFHQTIPVCYVISFFHAPSGLILAFATSCPGGD